MGFLVNKITGDGTTQTAVTNDATLEAVVNSLVAYNTTGSGLNFTVSINGSTIFSESVGANSTYRLPDKINLGAVSTLEVNAPTGLDVTVSYLQQAIDVVGALSAAQVLAQQASDDADRAAALVGALPVGTLDDLGTTASTAWSSQKIADELDLKLSLSGGTMTGAITSLKETSVAMAANDIDLSLGNYFTKTITTTTTLTVSNIPASGTVGYFILELTNGGSSAVTWFSGVKWAKGTAPVLTAAGIDLIRFVTRDGGTTWRASRIDEDSK